MPNLIVIDGDLVESIFHVKAESEPPSKSKEGNLFGNAHTRWIQRDLRVSHHIRAVQNRFNENRGWAARLEDFLRVDEEIFDVHGIQNQFFTEQARKKGFKLRPLLIAREGGVDEGCVVDPKHTKDVVDANEVVTIGIRVVRHGLGKGSKTHGQEESES